MQKPTFSIVVRRIVGIVCLTYLGWQFSLGKVSVWFVVLWVLLLLPILILAIKRSFLLATQPQESRPGHLDEFPRLSRSAWDALAAEIEALGFESRGVWVVGEKNPRVGVGVMQVFEHPQHKIIAEISQIFAPTRVVPIAITLVSYWGDAAELLRLYPPISATTPPIASPFAPPSEPSKATKTAVIALPVCSYSTHNRAPNWTLNLLEHPKVMGTRLVGASPLQLLETHLERRPLISRALEEAPISRDLVEVVHAYARGLRQIWQQRFRTQPFLPALWRAIRRNPKRTENFGELEPAIAALKSKTDA